MYNKAMSANVMQKIEFLTELFIFLSKRILLNHHVTLPMCKVQDLNSFSFAVVKHI